MSKTFFSTTTQKELAPFNLVHPVIWQLLTGSQCDSNSCINSCVCPARPLSVCHQFLNVASRRCGAMQVSRWRHWPKQKPSSERLSSIDYVHLMKVFDVVRRRDVDKSRRSVGLETSAQLYVRRAGARLSIFRTTELLGDRVGACLAHTSTV